jgi:hypothetical protein
VNVPGAPFQYDINAVFDWKDKAGVGISYKSDYAVSLSGWIMPNKSFSIGYSYDILLSNIKFFSGGSHEIMLGYTFGLTRKKLEEDIINLENRLKESEGKYNAIQARVDSTKTEITSAKEKITLTDEKYERITNELKDSVNVIKLRAIAAEEKLKGNSAQLVKISENADYVDMNGNPVEQGYYVVVRSFRNNAFAEFDKKKYLKKGYGLEYNKKTGWFHAYMSKHDSYNKALDNLKAARALYSDAWINVIR